MEKEKVGDSHSSSDPVSPTSNEMMKAKSPEMPLEKIKGVVEKLQASGEDIDLHDYNGTVIVEGHFDLEKLQNEAGDAINSIRYPSRIPTSGRCTMSLRWEMLEAPGSMLVADGCSSGPL
ncbi:hypothetical protein ZIOFF_001986 [Zingiber officinale]|uniref:Uncharacterized protein n=1 Tax=Zingiber officinale TaxID=94328 RepID=A0A8J5M886_ZINOF|nr:hypothetical protein ZIOFF_001986 [Zingiber officinale]